MEDLSSCEERIRKGWGTFMSVGEALLKIRNERLYRTGYASFEEYYRSKWQYQKSQVYRLIDAAKVLRALSPTGEVSGRPIDHLPTAESQVRPLVGLDEEVARTVWDRVVTEAKSGRTRITARLVTKHVRAVAPQRVKQTSARSVTEANPSSARNAVEEIKASLDELHALISDGENRIKAKPLCDKILRLFEGTPNGPEIPPP